MSVSRPRISVVSSYFPTLEEPYRGHSAYQTLRRMTGWADITGCCPLPRYPSWYPLRPREFRYQDWSRQEPPPDLPAEYTAYTTLPLVGRAFNGQFALRRVMPILRRQQPDLILSYWLYPDGYAAVRAAQILGIPSIVCSIGSDLRRIGDYWTRRFTRATLEDSTLVLTVSEELRRQALAYGIPPAKVRSILNGCDTTIFRPANRAEARLDLKLPPEGPMFLYVGSLIPSKGVSDLYQAWSTGPARSNGASLALIGQGPLSAQLALRAQAEGLAAQLLLPGAMPSGQVARWMAACDVFCLPSHSEGCPNVVLEALACGRPVVGSDVGGIPELIDDECGMLVPVQRPDLLAESMEQALRRDWPAETIARRHTRGWTQVALETQAACELALGRM